MDRRARRREIGVPDCISEGSLQAFVAMAEGLADVSRQMLAEAAGGAAAEDKPDRTFVTAMDRAIEVRLRETILEKQPGHGVWGEEFGRSDADAEFQWILDPIDGTAQFIAGIPVYSTLIALAQGGVPIIGIMDFPATGERWTGCRGHPPCITESPAACGPALVWAMPLCRQAARTSTPRPSVRCCPPSSSGRGGGSMAARR